MTALQLPYTHVMMMDNIVTNTLLSHGDFSTEEVEAWRKVRGMPPRLR